MAQAFTKKKLSGSLDGKQIKVFAGAGASGTIIHTAVGGTLSFDEIWLYASSGHTMDVLTTIQWGGVTSPDNDIKITIPPMAGRLMICDGMLLNNTSIVRAYAGVTNIIMIDGFVNQIV